MKGLGPNGETVNVQWYFTDKPFLPFSTVFCSRAWYDENPPWKHTQPGPIRHRGEWVNGAAPAPCCKVPFGDHAAFLGKGSAVRFSCAWFDPAVGPAPEASGAFGIVDFNRHGLGLAAQAERGIGSVVIRRHILGSAPEASGAFGIGDFNRHGLGLAAQAERGIGSVSVVHKVAGLAAQAERGIGSVSVVHKVAGLAAQAESGTGDAVFTGGNFQITGCSQCPSGTWNYWYLTVSGITGTADCTAHNGTFRLTWVGTGCEWDSDAQFGTGVPIWKLIYMGVGNWRLAPYDSTGSQLTYYSNTSYACLGPNTFTGIFGPPCGGGPLSITLTSS